MKVAAIIPAAGVGTRMQSPSPKQFIPLGDGSVLIHTLRKFAACSRVQTARVSLRETDMPGFRQELEQRGLSDFALLVAGGAHRQESVYNGLGTVDPDTDIVVVHDGVRPFVEVAMIEAVIDAAAEKGSAILALPCVDTVKQVERQQVVATLPREKIVMVQTPQAFRYQILEEAFERARADHYFASDESCLVERLGYPVAVLRGSERNIKITRPADLPLAELFVRQSARSQGFGTPGETCGQGAS